MNIRGTAYCKYCQFFNEHIVLTGDRESDEAGGWNWEAAAGTVCQRCGTVLNWLHEPPLKATLLPLVVQKRLHLTEEPPKKNWVMPK